MEKHKTDMHVLVACSFCGKFLGTRILLEKHIEEEHSTVEYGKVTSDKEYIEKLVAENAEVKNELRLVKDNFERLSEIFKKEQQEFNELKLNIDNDMSKTREEYRRMKTENEELKVKNETLYKLGEIALKQNRKNPAVKPTEDPDKIEIIEEETDDISCAVEKPL